MLSLGGCVAGRTGGGRLSGDRDLSSVLRVRPRALVGEAAREARLTVVAKSWKRLEARLTGVEGYSSSGDLERRKRSRGRTGGEYSSGREVLMKGRLGSRLLG